MNRILVPYDFSEQATNAFRFALQLGKAEVHLLNVVELLGKPVFALEEEVLQELRDQAEASALARFEAEAIKIYGAAINKIKLNVRFGYTSNVILDYINHNDIDLVIMGTKGAKGIHEMLIGSNTEKIVRASSVPVIAVKSFLKPEMIKNIVFPNTLLSDADEDLIKNIKVLQHAFNATLHIVYVNTPSNFQRDTITHAELKRFSKWYMFKYFTINIYNDIDEEAGILNFTHMIDGDMIALGTHGRKGLAHILNGSIAEDLVNHADLPVWTYTIKKEN